MTVANRDHPVARADRALITAALVALAAMALLAAVVVTVLAAPDPFDPLGDYPAQRVLNRVPGVEGPAVPVGDDLRVTGVKCNDSDRAVQVRGAYAWVSVDPRGSTVYVGGGLSERDPGCTTFRFANPMPPEVIARASRLGRSVWHLVGFDIPLRGNGRGEGERVDWQTENFTIIGER